MARSHRAHDPRRTGHQLAFPPYDSRQGRAGGALVERAALENFLWLLPRPCRCKAWVIGLESRVGSRLQPTLSGQCQTPILSLCDDDPPARRRASLMRAARRVVELPTDRQPVASQARPADGTEQTWRV